MLAYWRARSAFNPRDALPAGLIRGFETVSLNTGCVFPPPADYGVLVVVGEASGLDNRGWKPLPQGS
jgi:hypothetical protein